MYLKSFVLTCIITVISDYGSPVSKQGPWIGGCYVILWGRDVRHQYRSNDLSNLIL